MNEVTYRTLILCASIGRPGRNSAHTVPALSCGPGADMAHKSNSSVGGDAGGEHGFGVLGDRLV